MKPLRQKIKTGALISVQAFAHRTLIIIFLGVIIQLAVCWWNASLAKREERQIRNELQVFSRVIVSQTPTKIGLDYGEISHPFLLTSNLLEATTHQRQSGWFGFNDDAWLGYFFCMTPITIAKVHHYDKDKPARVAEHLLNKLSRFAPKWSRASSEPTAADDVYPYISEYAFGWPVRSMMFDVRYDGSSNWVYVTGGVRPDFTGMLPSRLASYLYSDTLYPIRPIWRGFLIDVVVLGVLADRLLVWILIPPIRLFFRRAIWVRRACRLDAGLCPYCKYPVKSAALCPECGWKRESGEFGTGKV